MIDIHTQTEFHSLVNPATEKTLALHFSAYSCQNKAYCNGRK
jgi:hypothetical protein